MLRIILYGAAALIIFIPALLITGLRFQPRPFPSFPPQTQQLNTIPLPNNLPAPVERYYKTIMGTEVPVIDTAVVDFRGKLRFAGITFPSRLRFIYDTGQGYRHYIESTLFGLPLLKVNEHYLDGKGRMELPVGVVENEPKIDMAANLGLWGESLFFPSIYLTDPRVRWQAIDDTTARLIVPYKEVEQTFTVKFDPQSGLLKSMEALRYREADSPEKIPWLLEVHSWTEFHGMMLPQYSTVTWADEGTPWLMLDIEDVTYNVDISDYIRAKGL